MPPPRAALHIMNVGVHGTTESTVGVSDKPSLIAWSKVEVGYRVADGWRGVGTMTAIVFRKERFIR